MRVLAYKKDSSRRRQRRMHQPPSHTRDVNDITHTNLDASVEMHGSNSSSSNAAPRAARAFKSTGSRPSATTTAPTRRLNTTPQTTNTSRKRRKRYKTARRPSSKQSKRQELLRHTHHRSRRAPTRATPWTRTSPYLEAAMPPKQSSPRPSPHHRCPRKTISAADYV